MGPRAGDSERDLPRREAHWRVARTWDGAPAPAAEHAEVSLRLEADRLHVVVDAPFHGDPPPEAPPGPTPGLWEHEVVELFLLGDDDRYLEIELGPHGHHWVLRLHGARRVVESGLAPAYAARRAGGRWRGAASGPAVWLPPGLRAANAYALHGAGAGRRFLAAAPVPGRGPDFHRLEAFPPLPWRG